MSTVIHSDQVRDAWLGRLNHLIDEVKSWAVELKLPTRTIEIGLKDSEIGKYKAPALMIQDGGIKLLLEPIAPSAPGADGVVDLYLMPSYDDIASLYLVEGQWMMHYMFPDDPTVGNIRDADGAALTKDSFQKVLEAMKNNAV